MYEFLRGKITSKGPTSVVIDVGGIGFRLEVSLRTAERVPPAGREASLLVHHRIQDDRDRLFGFVDEGERALFRRLLAVAGIGPAHGLALLSGHSPVEVWRLIREADWRGLAHTKGIGPKIAQRVCNELADEAGRQVAVAAAASEGDTASPPPATGEEAIAALMVLGYTEAQAARAIQAAAKELGAEAAVEDLVREGLKKA